MGNQLLASKIVIQEEEPKIRTIPGVATDVTGFEGITERGPVGAATLIQSPTEYDKIFGGYAANGFVRQAVDGFFQNGGTTCWVVRTVHYTDVTDPLTKTSAQASVTLQTGAVAAFGGSITSSNAAPYNLEPGDTLVVDTDAISPATATFNATAASRDSADGGDAWPKALTNGMILSVSVDAGTAQDVTFLTAEFASIGAATAAEVAAVIAAKLVGASVSVVGGQVRITSDRRGTSSGINVTGGTANAVLSFTTGNVAGTGNVANIDAVTVAEVKTIVEAAVAGVVVTDVGGRTKIARTGATGAGATVQVDPSSTTETIFGFDTAVHAGGSGAAVDTLRLDGKTDGTYAHTLKGKVENATSGNAAEFNVVVLKSGLIVETFPNVSMDDTLSNYVETVINHATTGSRYITAVDLDAGTGSAANDRPVNVTSAFLSGGNDGLVGLSDTDFTGASGANGKTGIRAFDLVKNLNLLAIPGRATSAVQNAMITYCEVTRGLSCFAILDPPANSSATAVITYFETTAALLGLSEFAAAYWPNVKVLNPNKSVFGNADQVVVPPSGHIAGVYARRSNARQGGVYDPPAGIEDGALFGVLGFETDECLDEEKRDLVAPKRINPLTALDGTPRFIDGSDTLKGTGNFPSVSERRGVIFIEQSLKNGLQFARHKRNSEALRSTCERSCELFLRDQMNVGAFRTTDPATAFFADFGNDLNPPSVQFTNKIIGRIGLATAKPVKWLILSFSQDTRAVEEELAA